MKAAFYTRQGPATEVLSVGEQPTPKPGPGEVRVRLRASGVNPSDWKMRQARSNRPMVAPLVIPHSDGAGEIDAVGEGVSDTRIGERVWVWNAQWKRPFGSAAQFVALPSAQAVRLPVGTSFAEGACLGIPAFTAVQAVRLAQVQPGMRVLVAGGAGSVGHYAIQFAKARGAEVFTTVSSAAKAAHARSAGADHAIDYRTEDVGARVRTLSNAAGLDAVIEMDLSNNAGQYPFVLRPHATVVVYGMSKSESTIPSQWLMQNSISLKLFLIYEISAADRDACLAEIAAWLPSARHTVAQRLPLDEIARAHDLVEAGTMIGNVVLDID